MSKEIFYKQSFLIKENGLNNSNQVAWIPEKYAKINEFIKIKGEDDIWVDGWKVMSVSNTRISEKELPDHRKMIRSHRMRTGDSMKKQN